MEPSGRNGWQPAATAPATKTGKSKRKLLPCTATSCLSRSMVRRGSECLPRQLQTKGFVGPTPRATRACMGDCQLAHLMAHREEIPCKSAFSDRASKPVRRGSPTLGRFDSCAAPSQGSPAKRADSTSQGRQRPAARSGARTPGNALCGGEDEDCRRAGPSRREGVGSSKARFSSIRRTRRSPTARAWIRSGATPEPGSGQLESVEVVTFEIVGDPRDALVPELASGRG